MVCYLLGAGFSKPAGGPLVREMLDNSYTRWLTGRQQDKLQGLMSRVGDDDSGGETIEGVWAAIDGAIDSRSEAYGLADTALGAASQLLLEVHHKVMDGFQRELVHGLKDVLNLPYLATVSLEKLLKARTFVSNPSSWFVGQASQWHQPERGEALLALIQADSHERAQAAAEALQAHHWPAEHVEALGQGLDRLLQQPLEKRSGTTRVQEFVRHVNSVREMPLGKALLGDQYDVDTRSIDEFLFRAHMTESREGLDRVRSVAGWFDAVGGLFLRLKPGDAVLTTNYDLLIELAEWMLPDEVVRSMRPLEFGTDYWKATWHGGVPAAHRVSYTGTGAVSLLKLHGSLAWKLCECDELTSSSPRVSSQPGEPSTAPCCNAKDPKRLRLMVPPKLGKEYSSRPLRSVWSVADQVLEACDHIVCVGHGMHEGDSQLLGMIAAARRGRESEWDTVTVVNPSSSDELIARYEAAFGQTVSPVWVSADDYFSRSWTAVLNS